jgi:lysophospholipase L1-like esterase
MRFLAFVSVCFSATAFGYNFGATMPVGDSLTSGWEPTGRGGYRGPLYEQLTHQLQPVGSLTSNGWNLTPDERAHEGHDGWRTEQISAGLSGWIDTYSPNTILLMTGTNNTGDWNDPALTRQKVSDLFDTVFALDPYRMLFAANIPDANPNISWEWAHRIHADNVDAAVRAEVLEHQLLGRAAYFVDVRSVIDPNLHLADAVHPTTEGYENIAGAFAQVEPVPEPGTLAAVLLGGVALLRRRKGA